MLKTTLTLIFFSVSSTFALNIRSSWPGNSGIRDIRGGININMPSEFARYGCNDVSVSNGVYTASCLSGLKRSGGLERKTTSIEYQKLCDGDELDKLHGYLKCHDQKKIKGLPTGPWLDSCVISAYDSTKSESGTYTVYCEIGNKFSFYPNFNFYSTEMKQQYINYGNYDGIKGVISESGILQLLTPGPYLNTCGDFDVSNGVYTASCSNGFNRSGVWEPKRTSIEYQKLCDGGELDNLYGYLKCHDQTKIKGLPTGPWLDSCVISAYNSTKSESGTYTVYCRIGDSKFDRFLIGHDFSYEMKQQYINYGNYDGIAGVRSESGILQLLTTGPYLNTCSGFDVSNGVYTASCLTESDGWTRKTSIEYQKLCDGDELDNLYGYLKCHDQTKIKGLPTGPWLDSCVISAYDSTKPESGTYTIYCKRNYVSFIEQHINYGDYSGQIWVNRDGHLQK